MEAYQERFIEEYWQVRSRTERLEKMLGELEAGELDFKLTCPPSLLYAQLNAMVEYLGVLDERKEIEGIDVGGGE